MACPFDKESLTQLKVFIDVCKTQPGVLHVPGLAFFRDYIETLGGKIPPAPKPEATEDENMSSAKEETKPKPSEPDSNVYEEEIDSDPESILEFDMEGCIEKEAIPEDYEMGDSSKVPTVEDEDAADEKRMEAQSQFSEGNFDKAIELYTEAIKLNPQHAILFTKRGQVHLKLQKPAACVKDCTHALELNCDSAPAFKFRGRAYRLMGDWALAAKDLRQACKIDFDEQADEWLREVTPNAQKIEQHELKAERKAKERSDRERVERVRKAQDAHTKAAAAKNDDADGIPDMSGMPDFGAAGMGMGGMPEMGDFFQLLQDPEILEACRDPEVSAAFEDIATNPANFSKYQDKPKVRAFIEKFQAKMPAGNPPGMGGMGGLGGLFRGPAGPAKDGPAPTKPTPETDDGLD